MQKIVKLNRAFLYCCMVVIFCLHFKGYAAPTQGKPVSITIKNSSLAEVLRQVSKKSGLYIYFQDADLAGHKNVTIDVKNKPVENVLHELLDGRGFSWVEVSENTIAVKKKKVSESDTNNIINRDTILNITGKISDELGNPLPGANVIIKGTTRGATTTSDGSFSIKSAATSAHVLIVSMIGYETVEKNIQGAGNVNINLRTSTSSLDEAVVIAYGTTTKRHSTGNVGVLKSQDIERQVINNPLLALSGRIAGLQISQASGMPGSGIRILIQGQNSIGKGNDPFYVIDGVPYTSQLLPNLGNVLGVSSSAGSSESNFGNPLSFINPSDIESIQVLKDADATAIYGSRAANGAILITTKRGKAGQLKIDLSLQSGIGEVARRLKLLNTEQYLEMRKEAYLNDGTPIPNAGGPSDISNYDLTFWEHNKQTDWQKELIGNTAQYHDFKLTLNGGNTNTQYLLGVGYHKETTVFPSDFGDRKGSVHFAVNSISNNEKFKFSFSGSYMVDKNNLTTYDITEYAMTLAPNQPSLKTADGTINWAPDSNGISSLDFFQPLALLNTKYNNRTKNLLSNLSIGYEIIKDLEVKSTFGYTDMTTTEFVPAPFSSIPPEQRISSTRRASYGNNSINSWIIEPQVNFNRRIAGGQLSILIGSTIQQNFGNRQLLRGIGYNSDIVLENINAASSVVVPENSTIASTYKYNAIFGRMNYNWSEKYIVNLTARRDGSSRFGSANRFHNFGAVGMAWIFSNEIYSKENLPFLSFGKLRASYGTTGNDQIGNYQYMSLYNNNNPSVPYSGGTSLYINSIANPYLQWEETRKFSAGVDVGFLKDRILVNVTYYSNISSNQLLSTPLPITTGVTSITTNLPAKVRNNGLEIALTTNNIKNSLFEWTTNFNITAPRNKLMYFKDLESSAFYSNAYRVGQPITIIKAYDFEGVNENTGLYEYINKDGKPVNDPSNDFENRTILINTAQTLFGGFQNHFTYGGLDLDVFLQFVKQKGKSYSYGNALPGAFAPTNQPATVLDRWRSVGDKKQIQKYSASNFDVLNPAFLIYDSDAVWTDASYARLKNISLSWLLPQNWIRKTKTQSARIYVQGQNLLTVTGYDGLDPETRSSLTLPPLRTIILGIQIIF